MFIGDRQFENLPGMVIADQSPINPPEQTDGKDVSRRKVGKADVAHQKMSRRLAGLGRQRCADEIAGHRQHHHGQCIDPVPQPYRRFIDIDRTDLFAVSLGFQHILL